MKSVTQPKDRKEYFRQWHLRNRDRRLVERRERYQRKREYEIAQTTEYHKNHPEVSKASYKKWASKNKPYLAARMGEYRKQHKHERTTTPEERMRIRMWSDLIKSKECVECYWCHKIVPVSEIEFDHIIPVSKGGRHVLENMCAACRPCNRRKSAKVILDYEI